MRVLVTGGAGYIGSRLLPELLRLGHDVVCYDRLDHGYQPIAMCFESPKFELVPADIQNTMLLQRYIKQADVIVHLAALVGYPICKEKPVEAVNINEHASHAINAIRHSYQRVIFASTGSVYGQLNDNLTCDEDTPLNPTSLYASTKAEAEKGFLDKSNSVVFRFATGFGLSPRMRDDTLVNHFTKMAVQDREIKLYQPHAMRSIVHVSDMVRAIIAGLEDLPEGVYNCAAVNLTKLDLTKLLRAVGVSYTLEVVEDQTDPECRDYKTRCDRLEQAGYHVSSVNVKAVIDGLARYYYAAPSEL